LRLLASSPLRLLATSAESPRVADLLCGGSWSAVETSGGLSRASVDNVVSQRSLSGNLLFVDGNLLLVGIVGFDIVRNRGSTGVVIGGRGGARVVAKVAVVDGLEGVSIGTGFLLGADLVVLGIESLGLRAVKVEPPVADEVVLVEDGSVGAEEGVLGESAKSVGCADVEHLTFGRRISVVA
jgi:hypothetical protein